MQVEIEYHRLDQEEAGVSGVIPAVHDGHTVVEQQLGGDGGGGGVRDGQWKKGGKEERGGQWKEEAGVGGVIPAVHSGLAVVDLQPGKGRTAAERKEEKETYRQR